MPQLFYAIEKTTCIMIDTNVCEFVVYNMYAYDNCGTLI